MVHKLCHEIFAAQAGLDSRARVRNSPRVSGPASSDDLLTSLLRDVSRSFYLTLRVLPAPIRLARVEEALTVLQNFSSADQQLIREVLTTITGGQELDLQRFAGATAQSPIALPDSAALDDYTYRVAGCVGEFWTKMCRTHLFPNAPLDEPGFLQNGIRFGKGLQLVNILRDLPRDLAQGRCYLPADQLRAAGLVPADLLKSENEPRLRPVYDPLLTLAEAHLAAGWAYTNALPRNQRRVRLACAWPVLIGVRTLARLRRGNPLDP
ncbi:MAG: squalene/phytoene synthase family protein, partial [Verrucomicrobia bacterium]|nr:squalene/phytoene synthase family protein [Verrucomicrobiota bacterium]